MRTVYVDSDFKCHLTGGEGLTAVETGSFDGRCDAFVEGYRLVPAGESWTREDGAVFEGCMVAPVTDVSLLQAMQQQYEAMLPELQDMREALNTLGVSVDA